MQVKTTVRYNLTAVKMDEFYYFILFIYFNPHLRICLLILEREKRRGGERETSMPPIHALPRYQTQNPGMCPDRESNPQPFGVQDDASTI